MDEVTMLPRGRKGGTDSGVSGRTLEPGAVTPELIVTPKRQRCRGPSLGAGTRGRDSSAARNSR
jgi:hypothetical protein